MNTLNSHIPIELMELLNTINNNINEVKERITRIEAQDHADAFRIIRSDINSEREQRIKLQLEIVRIKTQLAPIVVGISLVGAVVIDIVARAFLAH